MTDNENLSLRMLRPVIGPLLQSMDSDDLFELGAMVSLVAQVGAKRIAEEVEKRVDNNSVSKSDIAFLMLYTCVVGEKECAE